MPLWDDATAPYTGQGPQQDNSGLWGWLTSLFSPRPPSGVQGTWDPQRPGVSQTTDSLTSPGAALVQGTWNPQQARTAAAMTPSPNMTPEQARAAAGLPTWGGMSGIPASMLVAPPSMYTAGNPQPQAAWQQASTPEGYAAALAAARGAPAAATPSVLQPPAAAMMPPPPKPMPPPVITGPGTTTPLAWMPRAGGSQGWAGIQGLPGVQSDVRVQPFRNLRATDVQPMPPSPAVSGIPLTDTRSRNLTDAELAKMTNVDIARAAARTDLTYGDRMAILARLGR